MLLIICVCVIVNYLTSQVIAGYLQFRYNLGDGEAILKINSTSVNDSKFHDIQLLRQEQSVELLVDEIFVNRTISPGSEATLDILSEHFYVGAQINVRNGILVNGLKGCVVGLRLDQKEVPVGGENAHFTTLKISNGVQNHCPVGQLSKAPQSRTNIYIGIGVTLAVVYIIVFIFVITFVLVKFRRDRHRMHTLNLNSHEASRRQDQRSPQSKSQLLTFHINDTDPTHTFESATPVTDISTNPIAETAFYDNTNICETDSISSSKSSYHFPFSKEDLSAVSRSDPDTQGKSPHLNSHKSCDESIP